MMRNAGNIAVLSVAAALLLGAATQQQTAPPSQIPDAPSATKEKNQPFPSESAPPAAPKPQPAEQAPERPAQGAQPQQPSPPPTVKTVPRGTASKNQSEQNNDTPYTIPVAVNFVTVPVTVKDNSGKLVEGLVRKDFSVYEDGVPQRISFFTSDPFPLSAAVVIDRSLPSVEMNKVNASLPALAGAFSPYDEVAVYTYGNTVRQVRDFGAANDRFDQTLSTLKSDLKSGRQGGVPVVGTTPMNAGPSINGRPLNPGTPEVNSYQPESHALNDAILRAALDLATRQKARRRIIFVISNGEERDSNASYSEVMKVLLSNEIIVYSVGVGSAALPGYNKLSQLNLPGTGTLNILPKYVSATGGENFAELSRSAIERAYANLTEVARNQYTLGYTTRATAASNYRSVEVRVKRPGLKIYAKDGYFPLPPERAAPPKP